MLFLFLHFYYTTYVASKSRRAARKVSTEPVAAAAAKEISADGPASETKSAYMNGYVASGYSLRARKNESTNGDAATLAGVSQWVWANVSNHVVVPVVCPGDFMHLRVIIFIGRVTFRSWKRCVVGLLLRLDFNNRRSFCLQSWLVVYLEVFLCWWWVIANHFDVSCRISCNFSFARMQKFGRSTAHIYNRDIGHMLY